MKGALFLLCGMLLVSTGHAAEPAPATQPTVRPEWVTLDQNRESTFSYDRAGVSRSGEVLRVTTRAVYTEQGKADTLNLLKSGKQYQNLFETRFIIDLSCKERTSRLQRVSHLDAAGTPLKEFDLAGKTSWEEIPPGSRLEKVTEAECR